MSRIHDNLKGEMVTIRCAKCGMEARHRVGTIGSDVSEETGFSAVACSNGTVIYLCPGHAKVVGALARRLVDMCGTNMAYLPRMAQLGLGAGEKD